ncbi:MAG: GyrI-like domain-containing protein [Acidimicrobiia bacterium]|nr:GyrI-like domain-containing protein [Acidimicrobiia bacterium]
MQSTQLQDVEKLDLKKKYKHLYRPSATRVERVDVPELLFIMIDGAIEKGAGPSDSEAFRQSMEALYGVGYGLKFMSKLRPENPIDFTVMAAEGLWESESTEFAFDGSQPLAYTLMMLQPDHITEDMFDAAVAQAAEKRPNPALQQMRLLRWQEGPSIQIMHVGPYADEPRSLALMAGFASEHDYRFRGRHHEIYMGDPRRSKPENLKTILRQPVEPAR